MSSIIKIKAFLLFLLHCYCLTVWGTFYLPLWIHSLPLSTLLGILGNSLVWIASDKLFIIWLLFGLGQWDAPAKIK